MYDERSNSAQVYRIKRNGTDLKALTQPATGENPFSPIWSPDGTRILFHSMAAGHKQNTYFMNADGSDLQLVSYPDDFEVFASTTQWSPNNRYLAFAGQTVGNQDQVIKSSVCLLALGTDDLRCLADDVFSIFAWSRDSKQIAYVSPKGYETFNLEIVNIETGETRRILRYSETTPVQVNNMNSLMWTPDGSALVYELSISGSRDQTELYIINADGSGERRLTDSIGGAYAAAWWPNE
jgi:TolB protein